MASWRCAGPFRAPATAQAPPARAQQRKTVEPTSRGVKARRRALRTSDNMTKCGQWRDPSPWRRDPRAAVGRVAWRATPAVCPVCASPGERNAQGPPLPPARWTSPAAHNWVAAPAATSTSRHYSVCGPQPPNRRLARNRSRAANTAATPRTHGPHARTARDSDGPDCVSSKPPSANVDTWNSPAATHGPPATTPGLAPVRAARRNRGCAGRGPLASMSSAAPSRSHMPIHRRCRPRRTPPQQRTGRRAR